MRTYDNVTFLFLCLCIYHSAVSAHRVPLSAPKKQSSSAAASATAAEAPADFECGKPGGPCGGSLPADVKCAKGPGWCQPGYFCGRARHPQTRQLLDAGECQPVPKDCGTVGHLCCPSNAETPHTSRDDKMNRKAFCKDGSTCFFSWRTDLVAQEDMYAGNEGNTCGMVAKNCGTGPGTPCCPHLTNKQETNPKLVRVKCGDGTTGKDTWCMEDKVSAAGPMSFRTGTCRANPPGCGKMGKACCVFMPNRLFVGENCDDKLRCKDNVCRAR